jgi:hypothetical protein
MAHFPVAFRTGSKAWSGLRRVPSSRRCARSANGEIQNETWNLPYYPAYRDVWDNIFLGRMASHPWGAMRFVASFISGGIFDRYPKLRMGVLECGFGWLPFWGRRMDEQAHYVGGTAPWKHAPRRLFDEPR